MALHTPYIYSICFIWLLTACGGGAKQQQPANAATDSTQAMTIEDEQRIILFYGNSLTAGYGLDDVNEAFPALIQARVDSLGWGYTCVNAGLSGETTAGGLRRLSWVLAQKPTVFVLELGANDGLRGIPVTETASNLQAMVAQVKQSFPQCAIVLAGMEAPPNMGNDYTTAFRNTFTTVAQEAGITYLPFLLEGVAGNPELNQPDGIHPTAVGQTIVANNVWRVLQPLLQPQ